MKDGPFFSVLIPTRGQVAARNTGLGLSRGRYILFLGDDDWLLDPTYLQRVFRAQGQGEALVYTGGLLFGPMGARPLEPGEVGPWLLSTPTRRKLRRGPHKKGLDHTSSEPHEDFSMPRCLEENRLLASGTALPRAWLDLLGFLDEAMGDYWDLWLRAYRAGLPFCYLKGPAVGIGLHGGNQSIGRRAERAFYLEQLRTKHGLGPLALKNHAELAGGP